MARGGARAVAVVYSIILATSTFRAKRKDPTARHDRADARRTINPIITISPWLTCLTLSGKTLPISTPDPKTRPPFNMDPPSPPPRLLLRPPLTQTPAGNGVHLFPCFLSFAPPYFAPPSFAPLRSAHAPLVRRAAPTSLASLFSPPPPPFPSLLRGSWAWTWARRAAGRA